MCLKLSKKVFTVAPALIELSLIEPPGLIEPRSASHTNNTPETKDKENSKIPLNSQPPSMI